MSKPIPKRLIAKWMTTENYLKAFGYHTDNEDGVANLETPNAKNVEQVIRQFLIWAADNGFSLEYTPLPTEPFYVVE